MTKGLIAELALVFLLVVAGTFVVHPLILLLLLAPQSLWIRGSSWADIGLRRPTAVHHCDLVGAIGGILGFLCFACGRNLWTVILCLQHQVAVRVGVLF